MPDLVSVLASGCVGALATLAVQTYFGMRTARIDLMNDYIKDLSEIESLASEYWLEATALPAGDPKRRILQARLRGRLHAARCFNTVAGKFLGEDHATYIRLDEELFLTATGGDFESSKAIQDLPRADRVMSLCSDIRALLRLARRKAFWVR